MAANRLVSRGAAYFAAISTLNLLLIMAAIANDDSVGSSGIVLSPMKINAMSTTTGPVTATSTSTTTTIGITSRASISTKITTQATTTSKPRPPPLPSVASLVRSPGFDTVIKVIGGKDRPSTLAPSSTMIGAKGSLLPGGGVTSGDNSTLSGEGRIDLLNSTLSTSPFSTQNWTEIRAQYKSNALLPCHVRNSGDGVTVSWIRRKDYHLLTVGLQTYSSDDRFQAIHTQSPDDWTLKIKYVQPRDAGLYECQISTHPPSSILINLTIVEVRAEIVGGPEKIYKAGSTVELKCDLIDGTEEPEYVFWYQGLQMINYDRSRHINVTHYKSSSVLVLHNVQKSDTGNYSCVPSNAHPASIFVHIINGENPAAMQHGSHSTSCVPCPPLWFLSFLLSLTLQALYFHFLSNHVDRYHHDGVKTRAGATITSTKPHNHHNHHTSPNCQTTTITKSRRDNQRPHFTTEACRNLISHSFKVTGEISWTGALLPLPLTPEHLPIPSPNSPPPSSLSSSYNSVLSRVNSRQAQKLFLDVTPHSPRLTVR